MGVGSNKLLVVKGLRRVYTGDFCGGFSGNVKHDFVVISNRPFKLQAIPQWFESPVVYMGDLKLPQKNTSLKGPFKGQGMLLISVTVLSVFFNLCTSSLSPISTHCILNVSKSP